MLNALGTTLTLEDGSKPYVTPLKEDRGALASIALSAAIFVAMVIIQMMM